jgi:hypothetical protein
LEERVVQLTTELTCIGPELETICGEIHITSIPAKEEEEGMEGKLEYNEHMGK